jgi:hypothetical protein
MHINTQGTAEWLKLNNPHRLAQPERSHGYDDVDVTSVPVLLRYLIGSRADVIRVRVRGNRSHCSTLLSEHVCQLQTTCIFIQLMLHFFCECDVPM